MIEFLSKTNLCRSSFGPLLLFLGILLLAGCAGESTSSDYANPGRAETYDPQNTGYEKPWPFGDVGNGH
jgi:hypothetical protein